ncbi:site-specific integrase [Dysgonomonas sp. 521]|uniref:site-specific integrase n=1 Tax=Dysgonomonas sp. 521 TaxID=2302932 RepID=UPI0013D64039|nr:site-specific integrase [Dysgonomonas sp. 521]NDV96435.1 site-specific integrase [Dysgonomonas sp. 521]
MRSTFNILFYINKQKIKKNGKCPVLGRITLDGKVTQFSTRQQTDPGTWSAAEGLSTGKDKASRELNRKLEEFKSGLSTHYDRQIERNGYVTAESLKNAILGIGTGPAMLLKEFEQHNEEVRQSIGITKVKSTYKHYQENFKSLKRFIRHKYGMDDIAFDRLTYTFVEDFDFYLRVNVGMSPETVEKRIRCLKRIVRRAIHKEIIRRNPFAGFVTRKPEAGRKWLSKEDLDKIMQTPVEHKGVNLVRNLFIFSVFTGLSYSDIRGLRWENITTDEHGTRWIRQKRTKTGTQANVPLMDIPLSILEKYGLPDKNGKVFNVGTYSLIVFYLEDLRKICGLKTHLTYHMSRHTWATLICLSNGVPIETLSRTMGHQDIGTTQIYAKITTAKIDEDMQALEKRLGNKYRLAGKQEQTDTNQLKEKAV